MADDQRIDAGFDCADLEFDSLIDVREPALEPSALVVALAADFGKECRVLLAEAGDALRAEDVLLEELIDQREHQVLAHVLPLSVAERFGGLVAVGDAVRAGVVRDALALLAVHPERVVAGRAVDDPAQQVEAPLLAAALRALAPAAPR